MSHASGAVRLKDLSAFRAHDSPAIVRARRNHDSIVTRTASTGHGKRVRVKVPGNSPDPGRRVTTDDLGSLHSLLALGLDWIGPVRANVRGALTSNDAEYIHQLRVGLRRLRCLAGLIAALDAGRRKGKRGSIREELRWIGGLLGAARDLDVFADDILPVAMIGLPKVQVDALRRRALRMRSTQRARMRKAIASDRCSRLLAHLESMFSESPEASPARSGNSVARALVKSLDRRAGKACERARHLGRASSDQLHRLRIDVKKLRYVAEMLAPLYRKKPARDYLERVSGLQDTLGRLQDIITAQALILRIAKAVPDSPQAIAGAGECVAALTRLQPAALERIAVSTRKFKHARPFW